MSSGLILRDAAKLVIGPAKPDPLDAAPQDEELTRFGHF
jgi:hypothetical protein